MSMLDALGTQDIEEHNAIADHRCLCTENRSKSYAKYKATLVQIHDKTCMNLTYKLECAKLHAFALCCTTARFIMKQDGDMRAYAY